MDKQMIALVLMGVAALFSLISASNTWALKKNGSQDHGHKGVGTHCNDAISGAGKWGSVDTGITLDVFAMLLAVAAIVVSVMRPF